MKGPLLLLLGWSTLICGVIVGTYSSIYVLCNNLILMNLSFEDLAIKKSETYDDGMP